VKREKHGELAEDHCHDHNMPRKGGEWENKDEYLEIKSFVPLWSRRLWSDNANGRDVLGPLFSSDHPIDYGGFWGPGWLLRGLLLGSPHLLDLLVDGLLLLLLPAGGQGEHGDPTTTSSPLLTTLPSQMVPPPIHQLPPGPSLVQVAQHDKEERKEDAEHGKDDDHEGEQQLHLGQEGTAQASVHHHHTRPKSTCHVAHCPPKYLSALLSTLLFLDHKIMERTMHVSFMHTMTLVFAQIICSATFTFQLDQYTLCVSNILLLVNSICLDFNLLRS